MKRSWLGILAACALFVVAGFAEAQTAYRVTVSGVWTLPASGDNAAVGAFQDLVVAQSPGTTFTLSSAVQSPIQTIPGQTTYDVTAEFIVPVPVALSLSDSLTKFSVQSIGQAIMKAGRLKGTHEDEGPGPE